MYQAKHRRPYNIEEYPVSKFFAEIGITLGMILAMFMAAGLF